MPKKNLFDVQLFVSDIKTDNIFYIVGNKFRRQISLCFLQIFIYKNSK